MRHAHLIIDGFVQGVGFRRFVQRQAEALDLKGYVRNIEGGVEVVVEGESDAIDRLVEACRQGPPAANVEDVTVEEGTPSGLYKEFSVTA